jgi:hypothetical protein
MGGARNAATPISFGEGKAGSFENCYKLAHIILLSHGQTMDHPFPGAGPTVAAQARKASLCSLLRFAKCSSA